LSLAVAIRVPDGENWMAASWPEWAGIIDVDALNQQIYEHKPLNYNSIVSISYN
jgi:hypothetical protein